MLTHTTQVHRGVGVLVIMLGQMLPQIAMWFLLALCITLGFSLFFTLLLPGHVALEPTVNQWPAYAPFWYTITSPTTPPTFSPPYLSPLSPPSTSRRGLLGEFDLESVSTYAPYLPHEPTSILVPIFLW